MKPLFIINPRSGPKRRSDLAQVIRLNCTINHEVRVCDRKEDLDTIVADARQNGVDAVIAVGGDGTVHEVAKRLIGTDLALGVIPSGSGNGFAHHHHIPTSIRGAVRMLSTTKRITIDTGEANGLPFISTMGIGYAALIAHHFDELPRRGLRSYVRAALAAFRDYESENYDILIDGASLQRRAFIVEIANTAHWGNHFRIAAGASVLDGKLDLVLVDPISLLDAPLFGPRLRFGTAHRSRRVKIYRASEIVVRRAQDGPVHLDGEPMTMPTEVRIRVQPRSLHVLVPRNAEVI